MLSIEPISFQSINVRCSQNNKRKHIKRESDLHNPSSGSSAINNTLLSLAVLGMATTSGCSQDNYYDDFSQTQKNKSVSLGSQNSEHYVSKKYTYEKADEILSSIGLLEDDTLSIKNIKVIKCVDNNRVQHWVKFNKNNDEKIISGEGISLNPDWTEGKIYNFYAKEAENGGLNVTRNYNDDTKETQNYKLNYDGSVTEYDVLDNNFMLEKSTYRKQEDGKICRTFFNGEEIVYGSIRNFHDVFNYPTPVGFSADVTSWEYEESQ